MPSTSANITDLVMQTPFELNLQKLSLEALLDERERNRQREADIDNELLERKRKASSDAVKKFVQDMKSHGFSERDTLNAVKAEFAGEPAVGASSGSKKAGKGSAARGSGPRVGATYVNPNDPSQTWTKSTSLGAPARWLSRLVAESEHKSYEPFEQRS